MQLLWTSEALSDLARLHEFLAPREAPDATVASAARELARVPEILLRGAQAGTVLPAYLPRKVHKLAVGRFRILYECKGAAVYILRLRHTRETAT